MARLIHHPRAEVWIEPIAGENNKRVRVKALDPSLFVFVDQCTTTYPEELIEKILAVKGPGYLCDEIKRDESPEYVQQFLYFGLLGYADPEIFRGKRILDFGCGSGASTSILGRMFPESEIVAVELEQRLLDIARLRIRHHNLESRVQFFTKPVGNIWPEELGKFDFVVFSAVYEHLLPEERTCLLPLIWMHLQDDGILFLNQTPYRWFPLEVHTTGGLPFINYFPDWIAFFYARWFSKKVGPGSSWTQLLRAGIRGGSITEILGILKQNGSIPFLMEPSRLGLKDRIDLWRAEMEKTGHSMKVNMFYRLSRLIKFLTGFECLPKLTLALQKTKKV